MKLDVLSCKICHVIQPINNFYKNKRRLNGIVPDCKTCGLKYQKIRRKKSANVVTKRYERTFKGHLVRTYRNMLSRVSGIQKKKAHLYEGLEILDKHEFYNWSENSFHYHVLFNEWKLSEYNQTFTPSIDRINNSVGYIIGNMQWLTHSENSSKAGVERHRK